MEIKSADHATERTHRRLLQATVIGVVVLIVFLVRAPSQWMKLMAPDGALDPRTAAFLDDLRFVLGVFVAVGLLSTLSPSVRVGLSRSWRAPAPEPRSSRRLAWLFAVVASASRVIVAHFSDVGLGDDGARVAWLANWIQHPVPVWSGLWTPGHLYLHALVNVVIRDPVWSGVLLSAMASGIAAGLLVHSVERDWGIPAAVFTGVCLAFFPVSLAHGATPDVNPVFAAFPIMSAACVACYAKGGSRAWFVVGCLAVGWATWCRYEAALLVFAVALLLWPRWPALLGFVAGGMLPLGVWLVMESRTSGQVGHVAQVMHADPGMQGNAASRLFSLLGAVWQAIPLPVGVIGAAGAIRSLFARRGRAWLLLAVTHLTALVGSALVLGAGIQPRYYILAAALIAVYAGAGFGAIWEWNRRLGIGTALLATAMFVAAPAMYPNNNDLWIRRNPGLRGVVDDVRAYADGRDVIWVSEESGYFYWCRVRPPIASYFSMPRADSDPAALLVALDSTPAAVAAVAPQDRARERWSRFAALAAPQYDVLPVRTVQDYQIYNVVRRGPAGGQEAR